MKADRKQKQMLRIVQRGYAYVALWQACVFTLLILLVWANEVLDFASLYYGTPHRPLNLSRGCLSTAGVLFAAVIAIGNTFLQQRNIVRGMLVVCCYCNKVRVNSVAWQSVESYIGRHSMALFSHGVCPECLEKAKLEIVGGSAAPPVSPSI